MYIPHISTRQLLAVRDGSNNTPGGSMEVMAIAIGVIFGILAVLLVFTMVRRLRIREAEPRLLPGKYMKSLWWKWTPRGNFNRSRPMTTTLASAGTPLTADISSSNDHATSEPPQRGQSIRSIITLPSYSRLPKEEEQIIAREGERSGMDLVVEFPETAEEEEDRREEEMESLYQIRLRRREELAERDERRRLRREARAAGDTNRLQQLSHDSIVSREANNRENIQSANAMLAEHQSRDRHRRISSVTYADIGHVRHDGSRIRANSTESDQRPLLDNSARHSTHSILTMQSQARSSMSGISTLSTSLHSSVDDDDISPPNEAATATEEGDLSTAHIPPPSYDYDDWGEAPAYDPSNTGTREHEGHLSLQTTLPQIRIDAASPLNSMPVTPVSVVDTTAATTSHQPDSETVSNSHHPDEAA